MRTSYEVIVLGAGSGGLSIATFLARVGVRVLLVDRRAEAIGGDCLNFGCVPSKALIHVAREVNAARRAGAFGLSLSGAVDMALVRAYIKKTQAVFREHENPEYLREQGIAVVLGDAVFSGTSSVRVGANEYTAKHIVIATGSFSRPYTLPGAEQVRIHTNETIFDIETLPKEMVLIGGGPISLEIGQAFLSLGSRVSIVDTGTEILQKEVPEIAAQLRNTLAQEGMQFYLSATPKRIEGGTELVIETAGGVEKRLPFDTLFAAVGRVPNVEALDLKAAGIAHDGSHIDHDAYLRTSNHRVFVCGDAAGTYQFTHAAELHASIILHNLFSPWRKKVRYEHMAWVTYTSPELATFGQTEDALTKSGTRYEVVATTFTDDDRAIIDGYRKSAMRLLVSPKGLLLGGSVLAPTAGELVQELTLAYAEGIPLSRLSNKIYPYPTAARMHRRLSLLWRARSLSRPARVFLVLFYRVRRFLGLV